MLYSELWRNMIVIPDLEGKDFEGFVLELLSYRNILGKNSETLREKGAMHGIMRVMDILCKDFVSLDTSADNQLKLSENLRKNKFFTKMCNELLLSSVEGKMLCPKGMRSCPSSVYNNCGHFPGTSQYSVLGV